MQMTKANAGSLLVFDASKLQLEGEANAGQPQGDAVEGIVTERGMWSSAVQMVHLRELAAIVLGQQRVVFCWVL